MKHVILFLLLIGASSLAAQNAGIINSRFELSGILNGERMVWESQLAEIYLNKDNGQFKAYVSVDDLIQVSSSDDFEPGTEKDQDKYILLKSQLPLDQVLNNRNEPVSIQLPMTIIYNDLEVEARFNFIILALPKQGFSIVCQGVFDHSSLEVEGLKDLEDELYIVWNIIGK